MRAARRNARRKARRQRDAAFAGRLEGDGFELADGAPERLLGRIRQDSKALSKARKAAKKDPEAAGQVAALTAKVVANKQALAAMNAKMADPGEAALADIGRGALRRAVARATPPGLRTQKQRKALKDGPKDHAAALKALAEANAADVDPGVELLRLIGRKGEAQLKRDGAFEDTLDMLAAANVAAQDPGIAALAGLGRLALGSAPMRDREAEAVRAAGGPDPADLTRAALLRQLEAANEAEADPDQDRLAEIGALAIERRALDAVPAHLLSPSKVLRLAAVRAELDRLRVENEGVNAKLDAELDAFVARFATGKREGRRANRALVERAPRR